LHGLNVFFVVERPRLATIESVVVHGIPTNTDALEAVAILNGTTTTTTTTTTTDTGTGTTGVAGAARIGAGAGRTHRMNPLGSIDEGAFTGCFPAFI
jgi:hypothetical protein